MKFSCIYEYGWAFRFNKGFMRQIRRNTLYTQSQKQIHNFGVTGLVLKFQEFLKRVMNHQINLHIKASQLGDRLHGPNYQMIQDRIDIFDFPKRLKIKTSSKFLKPEQSLQTKNLLKAQIAFGYSKKLLQQKLKQDIFHQDQNLHDKDLIDRNLGNLSISYSTIKLDLNTLNTSQETIRMEPKKSKFCRTQRNSLVNKNSSFFQSRKSSQVSSNVISLKNRNFGFEGLSSIESQEMKPIQIKNIDFKIDKRSKDGASLNLNKRSQRLSSKLSPLGVDESQTRGIRDSSERKKQLNNLYTNKVESSRLKRQYEQSSMQSLYSQRIGSNESQAIRSIKRSTEMRQSKELQSRRIILSIRVKRKDKQNAESLLKNYRTSEIEREFQYNKSDKQKMNQTTSTRIRVYTSRGSGKHEKTNTEL
ncbi:UNKNOWN [Stylonychia lemnae]|uniref:Uncharacterized protein n=1 Tax=Stylonychia lemnae TaxID=5949 RepID=A0A077ZXT2_STYLE|nr:UNKNOWN [Stylonychia lemnae]|eukprot:CDW74047.1 UNKNOWN [Stylonychia lemnae]